MPALPFLVPVSTGLQGEQDLSGPSARPTADEGRAQPLALSPPVDGPHLTHFRSLCRFYPGKFGTGRGDLLIHFGPKGNKSPGLPVAPARGMSHLLLVMLPFTLLGLRSHTAATSCAPGGEGRDGTGSVSREDHEEELNPIHSTVAPKGDRLLRQGAPLITRSDSDWLPLQFPPPTCKCSPPSTGHWNFLKCPRRSDLPGHQSLVPS